VAVVYAVVKFVVPSATGCLGLIGALVTMGGECWTCDVGHEPQMEMSVLSDERPVRIDSESE
jgi:hypothetical protein